ncbi:Protein of unknown function (DUF3071) [Diaminobutyricimonas aerilata]|uniref:DUF3071 domain-containing protein n=1 Tax=Diaminobutyricimonas aerilata TaxID=1162967 RepID=A0A2M9CKE2_9MICO|nr:septation protein SepH [Diaminobutyricimonas aerilata]PJJ72362.1 Protein of unknown function (DUF3071) [Diaminobutyricimonas aerilata]
MHELRVIGSEGGALVVASDGGEQYRVPVDDVFHTQLRRATASTSTGRRLSPREIQAHIRSGMSAQDVAAVTGADLEYIQRFEGPVLAEREYVIDSALAVPVHTAVETDPLEGGTTFGSVIRERLHDLGASGERWASWKEQGGGWIVKLAFTAEHVEHDARWQFEPRKQQLSPLNHEAVTLSQQDDQARALIPRLRAVKFGDEPDSDSDRFDSGAFSVEPEPEPEPVRPTSRTAEIVSTGQTADLLEALRRRRGERETAGFGDPDPMGGAESAPATSSIRLIDVPLDDFPEESPTPPRQDTGPAPKQQARKGRATMPSWDEIVFGARPDDDLA